MTRKWIWIVVVLFTTILTGCGTEKPRPVRVVTRVDVACDRGYQVLRRQYTKPEKVSMVLNYLRLQENLGPPEVEPDAVAGERIQIDVTMSDGTHRFYYQQSGQFLSEQNENWHEINPELAADFDLHLQMIPTDEKPPARRQGDEI